MCLRIVFSRCAEFTSRSLWTPPVKLSVFLLSSPIAVRSLCRWRRHSSLTGLPCYAISLGRLGRSLTNGYLNRVSTVIAVPFAGARKESTSACKQSRRTCGSTKKPKLQLRFIHLFSRIPGSRTLQRFTTHLRERWTFLPSSFLDRNSSSSTPGHSLSSLQRCRSLYLAQRKKKSMRYGISSP